MFIWCGSSGDLNFRYIFGVRRYKYVFMNGDKDMAEILIGKGEEQYKLNTKMLNRHGVIAGATGTGKTVTLKVITEALSDMGVPVFLSDIKGDLASIVSEGIPDEKMEKRADELGIEDYTYKAFPVEFLDVFGQDGIFVRSSVSQMGPLMLSKLLGLNDVQEGVVNIAFKLADDSGLILEDLKDLRSVLNYLGENSTDISMNYGSVSKQSIGAILRSILVIEEQGGNVFFGEPSFDINDLIRLDSNGMGIVSILNSKKLMLSPQLYATFLFWLLSELYENLPEVGDLDQPKIVFFFDEAHILFKNNSDALLEKIELIVRLIRSKGVGVFFVTQNPTDIPDTVSSQLGTRIQHGLRTFSPKELKNIKAIADTMRNDESLDIEEEIKNLGVGEAIVSSLNEDGIPSLARKIKICPPRSKMGMVDIADINYAINHSELGDKYNEAIDNYSAFEKLQDMQNDKIEEERKLKEERTKINEENDRIEKEEKMIRDFEKNRERKAKSTRRSSSRNDSAMDKLAKNLMSSLGREIGRQITRGLFGTRKK